MTRLSQTANSGETPQIAEGALLEMFVLLWAGGNLSTGWKWTAGEEQGWITLSRALLRLRLLGSPEGLCLAGGWS